MDDAELQLLLRTVVAGVLGYVVGAEREYIAHREAGTSTFALVSLSSAMVTALAFLVFDPTSASRVVANVLVGIGFLGGGMIVKDVVHVRGLTTAAGCWAMASAGIVIGSGHIVLGVAISALVLVLFSAEHVERYIKGRKKGADAPGGVGRLRQP